MKVMIIPGNGNTDISENWIPYVQKRLAALGLEVIAKNMPDPDLARRQFWVPFIEKELNSDPSAILIGHSSGAVAILRYLEDHRARGAVLVGACHTDLGMEKERLSGYYSDAWRWDQIKEHVQWIIQFASQDDPFIPIEEARYINKKLDTEFHEYEDQGHFGSDVQKTQFPEIVDLIQKKLRHE